MKLSLFSLAYNILFPVSQGFFILGLQPREKAAMLVSFGWQYNIIFSWRIYMKIEFSSQREEMLLDLSSNMAAVTSCANQQFVMLKRFIWKRSNSLKWLKT